MTQKTLQEVVRELWDKEVIPIDMADPSDTKMIQDLCKAVKDAVDRIANNPIKSSRVNEVGNKIEPYIKNSISKLQGYTAETPEDVNGKKQSAGYPDILMTDSAGRFTYIECKSYNMSSINTALRSFYLSPLKNPKIIHDARHIVISLEIDNPNNKEYIAKSFKIIDVHALPCSLKTEWNSSNHLLYSQPLLGQS